MTYCSKYYFLGLKRNHKIYDLHKIITFAM